MWHVLGTVGVQELARPLIQVYMQQRRWRGIRVEGLARRAGAAQTMGGGIIIAYQLAGRDRATGGVRGGGLDTVTALWQAGKRQAGWQKGRCSTVGAGAPAPGGAGVHGAPRADGRRRRAGSK